MDERRIQPKLSPGIISIVVVFTSLCLSIFAVLALSTASNERELSAKLADSVTAYYEADADCVRLTNELGALWESKASDEALREWADSNGAVYGDSDGVLLVSFEKPVSESMTLSVSISLGVEFKVLSWKTVADGDWSPESGLDVWH